MRYYSIEEAIERINGSDLMTPRVVSVQQSINTFKFEPVVYNDEYIKEDNSIRILGKFTHDADDQVFIERTKALWIELTMMIKTGYLWMIFSKS